MKFILFTTFLLTVKFCTKQQFKIKIYLESLIFTTDTDILNVFIKLQSDDACSRVKPFRS